MLNKNCTVEILDEVNIKFHGLDPKTRRDLNNAVKFFIPHAKYSPAYKLGKWDGYERFCTVGGTSYLNIIDRLVPVIEKNGYGFQIIDNRVPKTFEFTEITADSYSHIKWPVGHVRAGEPIMVREHQVDIVNRYLKNLQGIQNLPTGSGKTLITAILSHQVQKYGRSIIIVPSKDLVVQTEADYKNMGLDVGVLYGDRKEPYHQHVICTWQSIEAMDKRSKKYDDTLDFDRFIDNVVCIICDEAHSAKASVLAKHLVTTFKHVPIRWGLTGTLPPEEYAFTHLLCAIGPVIHTVYATDLQSLGILSNLHISILQINDYLTNFKDYKDELNYLVTDPVRVKFVSTIISDILPTGNTLILVDRVKTGQMLQKLIPNSVFISGSTKSKDRKTEYKELSTMDDKHIIATFGICSTGIDVPRVFNLVLFEPGKSFVRVIQSIGRGLRVAKDKDFVNVYDITSTAKFSKNHLTKRKQFYRTANYPFEVKLVDLTV